MGISAGAAVLPENEALNVCSAGPPIMFKVPPVQFSAALSTLTEPVVFWGVAFVKLPVMLKLHVSLHYRTEF